MMFETMIEPEPFNVFSHDVAAFFQGGERSSYEAPIYNSNKRNSGGIAKSTKKILLPNDFEPSPYSVILGRGKKCTDACGTRRLRIICMMFLPRYTKARSKDEKSEIVSEIQDTVRAACPNQLGAFVRSTSDGWIEVESIIAREKIGQVLRDLLHTKYRSSVKNKIAVRRERRIAARNNSISSAEDSNDESSSSSSDDIIISRDMFM